MFAIRSYLLSIGVLSAAIGGWNCGERKAGGNAGNGGSKPILATQPDSSFQGGTIYENNSSVRKKIALEDGTGVMLLPGTIMRVSKTFNKEKRGLQISGEAFFEVHGDSLKPFIVYTRDLRIEVLGTRFRVDAFADRPGEEVDLVSGNLKVSKSYHSSTDNEPEVLHAGEMVMINRDIDLMEKEKMDSTDWRKWEGVHL